MRNCLLLVMFAWFVSGCASHDGYVLTGKVPEAWDGKPVSLIVADGESPYAIDSATVSGGEFRFRGKFDIPRLCAVVIYLDPENRQDRKMNVSCSLFLDSTAVEAVCDYSGGEAVFTFTGGDTQTEYQAFLDAQAVVRNEAKELSAAYRQAYYYGGSEKHGEAVELARQASAKRKEAEDLQVRYVNGHPGSVVSLYALRQVVAEDTELSREEMQRLFATLSIGLQESEMGRVVAEIIREKRIIPGLAFPDVVLTDVNGQPKRLSDFVRPGHYTLIEFWASWCGPCRAEIPHLRRSYEKYQAKGFEIVSISIDQKAADWHKALGEEKMPWGQLLESGRTGRDAYGVTGVPTSILVDDEGRIFRLNARGGWLDGALQEVYD